MPRIRNILILIFMLMLFLNVKNTQGETYSTNIISDDCSNSSTINWNLSSSTTIDSAEDYYIIRQGGSNMNALSSYYFNYDTADTIGFMFRRYAATDNDKLRFGIGNYGNYSGIGLEYLFKVYDYNNKELYFETNTSFYADCFNNCVYKRKNYQDFLIIISNSSTGNNNVSLSYKNLTAYNDPFIMSGFTTIFNITLNASLMGDLSFKKVIHLDTQNVDNNATIRFLDVAFITFMLNNYTRNITINDSITREILNTSSITFDGNTYFTTNGTINVNFVSESAANQIYDNVIVDSSDFGGYNTAVYNGVNFSSGAYTEFNLSSINVHFLVFDPFNVSLQPYEVSYNTSNKSSALITGISLNLTHRYDTYNFQISTNGHTFRTTPYSHNFGANYSAGSEWITLLPVYCHQYATDSFSGDGLNTFSVNALGTTWFTNNGTCTMALENWNECTDLKNNVVVDSPENGGYFTKVFNGLNINNYNFPMENVRIQMIGSNALDQSTIPAISCLVNATTITNDGTTCYLNFSQGQADLSISALGGYNTSTDTFATIGNTTYYRNVTLAKTMNFLIKREYDQSCFPFNTNDNMSMVVYCDGASQQFNVTQCDHNFTIGCSFDSIILSHNNGTFNYFRSLIPAYNDSLVTWYMLDLNQDTGVQVIINLLDYSGQYNSGIIRLKRYFGTNIAEIIEQNFDIDTSVNLYLLKHARYSVEICNTGGSCVSLGEIIGDVAEEKTLTIPTIGFFPENSLLGNNITWQMNWTPNIRIYFNYNDTTHLTSMIEWLVYNGSNTSQLYYNNTIMTYDLYASYVIPAGYQNTTFLACFVAYHPAFDEPIRDCTAFYDIGKPFGSWEGFTDFEINKVKFWGALIFLFVIMFLFSPFSINAGLVTTNIFLWLFIKFNWLLTGNPVRDYIILIICAALSGFYIISTATKTGGTSA